MLNQTPSEIMPLYVPELATVERKIRKVAIGIAIAAFFVIVVSGVLTKLLREYASKQQHAPSFGRLHIRYEPGHETPYVDVCADRRWVE